MLYRWGHDTLLEKVDANNSIATKLRLIPKAQTHSTSTFCRSLAYAGVLLRTPPPRSGKLLLAVNNSAAIWMEHLPGHI
ncbi:hypothetical protein SAMN05216387_10247 [Nitrosovibrio tenuis]|uniref:Uncharacterized protein n=1 Tax=Nitrosovibrio tenuis TaxID=1233 RepID=A0A1H7I8Y0_9PROT|nr:hypothetical protein SAMN05216387_10247 [Nitrosovibrio tenuis]